MEIPILINETSQEYGTLDKTEHFDTEIILSCSNVNYMHNKSIQVTETTTINSVDRDIRILWT